MNMVYSETSAGGSVIAHARGDASESGGDSLSNAVEQDKPKPKIYPNPSSGYFFVETKNGVEKFEIYNLTGEMVLQQITSSFERKIPVAIADQPDGIYFIRIYSDKQIHTYKIIKQ